MPGEAGEADGGQEDGDKTDSPPPVVVDVAGLAGRVLSMPVAESRYSALRAVAGGLAWLKEPVIGVLGEGASVPDGSEPRPVLERYDLGRRKSTELVSGLDWFEVSGDGEWLVVRDGGELRVVPAQRKADQDGDDTVQVDLSRARFLADPAALWRHAYGETAPVHAARLLGAGHVRGGLGRGWRGVPAGAGRGSAAQPSSPTCSGRWPASWAPRTPTSGRPARRGRTATVSPACSARTWPGTRTAAGG